MIRTAVVRRALLAGCAEAKALAATIEQAQAAEVAAMETILDRL